MKWSNIPVLLVFIAILISCSEQTQDKTPYENNFESLEQANPVPEWFKDAKFGIYFHWGVYTVPAFANEWYPRNMYIDGTSENRHHKQVYGDPASWPYNNFITGANDKQGNFVKFEPKLKSEGGSFDPQEWAQLFADAGAKFAGPVAEHHDGFSMWASKVNPWNAKDKGPQLDLVGLLTDAIREQNMKVILSMHHAYNITGFYDHVPEMEDPELKILYGQQGKEKNEELWLAKHKEIIDDYRPDIIWQDFNLHKISQPVLLQFLAYYYNQANSWDKEVVATYKDGLNTKCAVLDYERGGPVDITDNYWLTDDAISSSSWCYTEGIGYYSEKQVLHGFLDRISKNGNLLLNLSPKADGTIPQEQKDILHAMGNWLKKYGEAVYATRAWDKYGEGPTKMGADHGVFMEPAAGTAADIRYTRSKDNSTLYAILLGWDEGQKNVLLGALASGRIDLSSLTSVELIDNEAGTYKTLSYRQNENGLEVELPEKSFIELAYVLKLSFADEIPEYNNYVNFNTSPHYFLIPGNNKGTLLLNAELKLGSARRDAASQWKLEQVGNGLYLILNRENPEKALECTVEDTLKLADLSKNENQVWKIHDAHSGYFTITNQQFPGKILGINGELAEGAGAAIFDLGNNRFKWQLKEVCETEQAAYKPHTIPGTVEAEDYDIGCPEDAYHDSEERNQGGKYRPEEAVDIDVCEGGYAVGWTSGGEWLVYTVYVEKSASYTVKLNVSTNSDQAKMRLECDGKDKTGSISVPNTGGFQNYQEINKTIDLDAGEHLLKVVIESGPFNLDKMVFEKVK
ncbi:alpha-L-fucosidase [Maribellus sediminis]|uniref:alpha-L-fucosidase n=1 Tax=Maribellus sediminis TaxID=2696285 RepID=UPI00142FBF98|nr:alpha-L-fucosidase [Maribellus sediminis]